MTADHVRDQIARGNAADELARLVSHLGLTADQIESIADAIRNAPLGIAAVGRVLAFGARAGSEAGSNRGRTVDDHVDAAIRHVDVVALNPASKADLRDFGEGGTGELHITNAAGRCLLAIELIERAGKC